MRMKFAPPSCRPRGWCGSCLCLLVRKPPRCVLLCLNEVAKDMQDLLSRLIGENITLDLLPRS